MTPSGGHLLSLQPQKMVSDLEAKEKNSFREGRAEEKDHLSDLL